MKPPRFGLTDWFPVDGMSQPQEYETCLTRTEAGTLCTGYWIRQTDNGIPVNRWFAVGKNPQPLDPQPLYYSRLVQPETA